MQLDPEDIAICLLDETDAIAPGGAPMSTPIVMTSLFAFPTLEALQQGLANESTTHVYSRGQNPTVEVLERIPVSEIEHVRVTLLTSKCQPRPTVDNDGFCRWKIDLAPNTQAEVQLAFGVSLAPSVEGV